MRTLIVFLIILSIAAPCQAVDWQARNIGIQNDKWFHIGVGFAVDAALKPNKKISWLQRKLIVAGVGTLKEISDTHRGGRFDGEDLAATVIGGLLGDVVKLEWNF